VTKKEKIWACIGAAGLAPLTAIKDLAWQPITSRLGALSNCSAGSESGKSAWKGAIGRGPYIYYQEKQTEQLTCYQELNSFRLKTKLGSC
jgi:hypothetical protein